MYDLCTRRSTPNYDGGGGWLAGRSLWAQPAVFASSVRHSTCTQKYPRAVARAKHRNSAPPMYPMVFSEMYCEAYAPPSTAIAVAITWPRIAPSATPGQCAFASAYRQHANLSSPDRDKKHTGRTDICSTFFPCTSEPHSVVGPPQHDLTNASITKQLQHASKQPITRYIMPGTDAPSGECAAPSATVASIERSPHSARNMSTPTYAGTTPSA